MLAPPRLRARRRTRLLSLVILKVFTLFVITILKPIVSADFLSNVCPPEGFQLRISCVVKVAYMSAMQLHYG